MAACSLWVSWATAASAWPYAVAQAQKIAAPCYWAWWPPIFSSAASLAQSQLQHMQYHRGPMFGGG